VVMMRLYQDISAREYQYKQQLQKDKRPAPRARGAYTKFWPTT